MADEVKGLLIQVSATTELLRSNLAQAERAIASFENTSNQMATRVDQSFKRVTASSGQMRAGFQQLGFQINDVATQFASGTRPMQIFAQQGSQIIQAIGLMSNSTKGLIGFLAGPWGAVLTAATVVLTPFIAKLFDTGEQSDEVKKKVEALAQAINQLNNLKISPRAAVLDELSRTEIQLRTLEAQRGRPGTRGDALDRAAEIRTVRDKINGLKEQLAINDQIVKQQARIDAAYPKDKKTKPKQIKEDADLAIKSVGTLAFELGNLDLGALMKKQQSTVLKDLGIDGEGQLRDRVDAIDKAADVEYEARKAVNDNLAQQLDRQIQFSAHLFEDAFRGGTKAIWGDFKNLGLRVIAEVLAKFVVSNIGGGGGGGFNFGSAISSAFSSVLGFASGGSPPVGRASIVGERGPELFVPKVAGTIVPNHKLGGGDAVVYQTINVAGGVDFATREELPRWMLAAKHGAIQAINESRRRAA